MVNYHAGASRTCVHEFMYVSICHTYIYVETNEWNLFDSDGNSDEDQSAVVRKDKKDTRVNPMIQRVP